eukprot:CAMPEP_0203971192 /NCGR_PEP_ID=MMETSP0359-20131031/98347_1 /ASSEMBLY_ACC=CAM_ASM_000338 /TAXON_ID=268821 /ORGANISM="Scrippsiella Hangoei, Strain SHTV-5" /LENGTH=176 /DNA_ID=CAMNT_0050909159 /DNA_START=63 /DNA_END=593 /DNA_ORIENTATION=-
MAPRRVLLAVALAVLAAAPGSLAEEQSLEGAGRPGTVAEEKSLRGAGSPFVDFARMPNYGAISANGVPSIDRTGLYDDTTEDEDFADPDKGDDDDDYDDDDKAESTNSTKSRQDGADAESNGDDDDDDDDDDDGDNEAESTNSTSSRQDLVSSVAPLARVWVPACSACLAIGLSVV